MKLRQGTSCACPALVRARAAAVLKHAKDDAFVATALFMCREDSKEAIAAAATDGDGDGGGDGGGVVTEAAAAGGADPMSMPPHGTEVWPMQPLLWSPVALPC